MHFNNLHFPNESLFQMRHAKLGTVLQLLSFFCRFLSVNFSGEIKQLPKKSLNKQRGFLFFLYFKSLAIYHIYIGVSYIFCISLFLQFDCKLLLLHLSFIKRKKKGLILNFCEGLVNVVMPECSLLII